MSGGSNLPLLQTGTEMGWGISLNLMPRLLPGEEVLCARQWLWGVSAKSLPTYRWEVSLPPIEEMGLCVTNFRSLGLRQ